MLVQRVGHSKLLFKVTSIGVLDTKHIFVKSSSITPPSILAKINEGGVIQLETQAY